MNTRIFTVALFKAAIYQPSIKVVSRGKDKSVVAAALSGKRENQKQL